MRGVPRILGGTTPLHKPKNPELKLLVRTSSLHRTTQTCLTQMRIHRLNTKCTTPASRNSCPSGWRLLGLVLCPLEFLPEQQENTQPEGHSKMCAQLYLFSELTRKRTPTQRVEPAGRNHNVMPGHLIMGTMLQGPRQNMGHGQGGMCGMMSGGTWALLLGSMFSIHASSSKTLSSWQAHPHQELCTPAGSLEATHDITLRETTPRSPRSRSPRSRSPSRTLRDKERWLLRLNVWSKRVKGGGKS